MGSWKKFVTSKGEHATFLHWVFHSYRKKQEKLGIV